MIPPALNDALSCLCLTVVCLACLLHLNAMGRQSPLCERLGFVLTAAGSFGAAIAYYKPVVDDFDPDLILYIGMALIALAMARGDLRDFLIRAGRWDGNDRRQRT